ncbi:SRPBCC family protein [Arthrobacter sp. H14]|uniref:SRPBCC family protein n=1 Tax=Arthrobacter sp. H14 TaxID=1312959 RepID=UPI0004B78F24|nr:SRPBCC family protein [Arthrobacter sp. H14]
MAEKESKSGSLLETLPLDGLKDQAAEYGKSLINSTLGKASDKVEDLTGKITDFASGNSERNDDEPDDDESEENSGGEDEKSKNPLKAVGRAFSWAKSKVMGGGGGDAGQESDSDESEESGKKSGGPDSGAEEAGGEKFTGSGASGSKEQKLVNLVEWIDVGVPVTVAYNQWTQFEEWSDFMKKVETSEHSEEEGTVKFKGQVFLSHRTWDATIKEMVPDDRIIWKSTGQKGHLDGAVTFHEYGPRLTKICIVVEYYPKGLFEKTAQIWRAVGRRVRVEMKRYVRHVMTTTILDPDAVEGWRGEIRDEEIIRTHEEVVEQEQSEAEGADGSEDGEGEEEYDDEEYEGEYEEEPDAGEEAEYEDEDDENSEEPAGEEDENAGSEESNESAEEDAEEVEEGIEPEEAERQPA